MRGTNSGNKQRADYGQGQYQIDASDFMLMPEAMTAHLRQTLVSPDYTPPLRHDAGMAAGLSIFADARGPSSSRESELPKSPAEPSHAELSMALYAVHEEASAILAEAWRLSPDVRIVIGSHHHLREGGGHIYPLAAVVWVSDWIASAAGARMGSEVDGAQADTATKELHFTKANRAELSAKAPEILEMSA